ncbi:MAG: hypothetical protein JNL18_20660 [Planctomycetaceae bacterium]|nr:hypothetical protein [Planctomycetaceae bacterium]
MRKNLVIAAVGDESVHAAWLTGGDRSFDLALIYFGDQTERYADQADFYQARKGIKFSLLHEALTGSLAPLLARYEYIWMPDDDIAASAAQIDRLFQLAHQHRLAICQPAIGQGDVSFAALRAAPAYVLRYSQFVEIMCPLFSREALARVLPTFTANVSAWGIDWLWASMYGPEDLAVIDEVAVNHTRPLQSGGVHRRLAALGVDPDQEHRQLMAKHGINNRRIHKAMCRGTARLRGIRIDGRTTWTRSWLAAALKLRSAR